MSRYKLILEYDGTGYSGWQAQKNAKSVQGALIGAAQDFLGMQVEVQGAGRTDAGVHALGQAAHLDCAKKVDPLTLRIGLNDRLPASVNILSVENAPERFHARHWAVGRSYLYLIAKRRTALAKKNVWWVKDSLNVGKMRQALKVFEGFHDFASFSDKRMDKDTSTKVQIDGITMEAFHDLLVIRIVGSHFLWKMVRRIVGMTVEAGRGKITPVELDVMLKTFSDLPARHTAPPSGLYLERVLYEGDSLPDLKPPVYLL